MIVKFLGISATVLFCFASGSQALKSIMDGHSDGVSLGLIWMIVLGLIEMLIYVPIVIGWDWVLLSSYIIQLLFLLIVAFYKHRGKK